MLFVCLDANAVNVERPLESNAHVHLLEAAASGRIGICVPRLVLDEVLNKWRERVADLDAERKKFETRLIEIGAISNEDRADSI